MRSTFIVSLVLVLVSQAAFRLSAAEPRTFPYEAVIDGDEEYVRSGPGPKYYPTEKLKRGDRVTVQRHDPGGWCMIAPTTHSFSWVRSDHVQKLAHNQGAIIANNAVVYVGSSLADVKDVYQRHLSKGDHVEILGEKHFPGEPANLPMLKIKPPTHEFRWISAKSLVPVDAQGRPIAPLEMAHKPGLNAIPEKSTEPTANDPFTPVADEFASRKGSANSNEIVERPLVRLQAIDTGDVANSRGNGANPPQVETLKSRLTKLDDEFTETLKLEPNEWVLASLGERYRQLDQESGQPNFSQLVKQRMEALNRYGKLQQEYNEFLQLSQATKQKDAQLLGMQQQLAGQTVIPTGLNGTPSATTTPGLVPQPQPDPQGVPAPVTATPVPQPSPTPTPAPAPAPAPATTPATGVPAPVAKFDGAGIVQRSAPFPGAPPFVLLAPNGRVLAYLQPQPGVDLERHVGRALGLRGPRGFRPELQTDLIQVREVQPVQLRGMPAGQ